MASQPGADLQIMEAFRQMAPLLGATKSDQTLHLEPNPGQPKKQRKGEGQTAQPKQQIKKEPMDSTEHLQQTVRLLARIALRQDQDLQALKQEDSFLFFFNNKEASGSLQILLRTAAQWKEQVQQNPSPEIWVPLRQRLLQVLLQTLLQRLNELGASDRNSELWKTAVTNQVLLEDQTCPFLQWNQHAKKLQIGTQQPLSLKKVVQNVEELLDMCKSARSSNPSTPFRRIPRVSRPRGSCR